MDSSEKVLSFVLLAPKGLNPRTQIVIYWVGERYTRSRLVWGPATQPWEMFKGNGFWKQQENLKLKAAFKWNQVGLILQGFSCTCGLYVIRLSKIARLFKHCTIITILLQTLQTAFLWLWNRTVSPMRSLKKLGSNLSFHSPIMGDQRDSGFTQKCSGV